jgi:outer membrane protein assembly factor BamB
MDAALVLTNQPRGQTMLRGMIAFAVIALALGPVCADDWPQWMGPKRDGVWRETGVLTKFPADGPKVLWRANVAGGYAGPAVADGRVYVQDFVTDADTRKASNPNQRAKIDGTERVLCLDATTGKLLWKHENKLTYHISYPAGPRCTPTVSGGKVYALGAMGHLFCLDAAKGTVLWSKDFATDYGADVPNWGYAGHPLVDGERLFCIVGGPGSVAVAFHKDSGKEIWKALDAKEPGYAPPTMIEAGGARQLVIWDAENITSLEPATGKRHWSVKLEPAFGMSIMGPRQHGDYLFTGAIGFHAVLLKLDRAKPGASEVWRGKKGHAIYPVNSTPIIDDGILYGVDQPGPLMAVKLETGDRLWETFEPVTGEGKANSGTAFLVKNGDRFFIFNELGELVIAKLSPKEYQEIGRAKILEPTQTAFGRDVLWSHPAFANRRMFARNDKELVCVSLEADRR